MLLLGVWLLAALITIVGISRLLAFGAGADAHLAEPRPGRRPGTWAALRVGAPVALATALALVAAESAISPQTDDRSVVHLQAEPAPSVARLAEPSQPARRPTERRRDARARRDPVGRSAVLARFTPAASRAPATRLPAAALPEARRRTVLRRVSALRQRPRRPGAFRPTRTARPAPGPARPVAIPAAVAPPGPQAEGGGKPGRTHPVHGTNPGHDGEPGPPPGRGRKH